MGNTPGVRLITNLQPYNANHDWPAAVTPDRNTCCPLTHSIIRDDVANIQRAIKAES